MIIAPAVVIQPTAALAVSAGPDAPAVEIERRSVLARLVSFLRKN